MRDVRELAAADCNVTINAKELLETVRIIRAEERAAALRERAQRVYSTKEVSAILGAKDKTIYQWIATGKVEASQPAGPGGSYFITEAELERLKNKH